MCRRFDSGSAHLGISLFRLVVGADFLVAEIFSGHGLCANDLKLHEVVGETNIERPGECEADAMDQSKPLSPIDSTIAGQ